MCASGQQRAAVPVPTSQNPIAQWALKVSMSFISSGFPPENPGSVSIDRICVHCGCRTMWLTYHRFVLYWVHGREGRRGGSSGQLPGGGRARERPVREGSGGRRGGEIHQPAEAEPRRYPGGEALLDRGRRLEGGFPC